MQHMSWRRLLAAAVMLLHSSLVVAGPQLAPLELDCLVSSSDYPGVGTVFEPNRASVNALKHMPGGAVLVDKIGGYEFWALGYGIRADRERTFFTSFQVAIRDAATGSFVHASGEPSHAPGRPPSPARVALVQYADEGFFELAELAFECRAKQ